MNPSDVAQALINLGKKKQCFSSANLDDLSGCRLGIPAEFLMRLCLRELAKQNFNSVSSFLDDFLTKTSNLEIHVMIVFSGINDPWNINFSSDSKIKSKQKSAPVSQSSIANLDKFPEIQNNSSNSIQNKSSQESVSYTHLTLPTILLV